MRREISKIMELAEHTKIRTCESQRRNKLCFTRENVDPENIFVTHSLRPIQTPLSYYLPKNLLSDKNVC